jgi:hypothetical protein
VSKSPRNIRQARSVRDDDGSVQDSPEEILDRLIRYRDSQNGHSSPLVAGSPVAGSPAVATPPAPSLRLRTPGPDARAAEWGALQELGRQETEARAWHHERDSRWRQTRNAVPATVFGQFLAVLACTLAVVAFEQLATTVALEVVGAAAAIGLIAATRRVPLALWWTFGVVLGGVLGRWS